MYASSTPATRDSRSPRIASGPYVTASRSVSGRATTVSVFARSRRRLPVRRSSIRPAAARRSASRLAVGWETPNRLPISVAEYSSPGCRYSQASSSPWKGERSSGSRRGGACTSCMLACNVRMVASVRQRGRVRAQPAVHVPVAPLAGSELGRAEHALQLEPGLLQRPALRDVLRMGTGLDALRRSVVEQVVAQHRLRVPTDTAPAPLRQ